MSKVIGFGEVVEGYEIPVLNEREVRAAAGIIFLCAFSSILYALLKWKFAPLKYFIIAFLVDLIIRVFINPRFSPTLIIGRLIVSRQVPEYVGAAQKKFAWIIGLVLATLMFTLIVLLNSYGNFTGVICTICLAFLFFEASFGICLGCLFYGWYYGKKAQYCPGEVCDVKLKQDIQKTSGTQVLIVLAFLAFLVLTVFLLNDSFIEKPKNLMKVLESFTSK